MAGLLNILLAANASSSSEQELEIINFTPIQDYTNTNFTELNTGIFTPIGDKLIVQDDTTNYRFYEIALSPAWYGLPADDTGHTQDGSTGRISTYQYLNLFWNEDGTILWGCRSSGSGEIDGYDLGTPYDITSLTSATPDYEIDFDAEFESILLVTWADFSLDGTKLFTAGNLTRTGNFQITEYPLDVAYDLTSYSSGVVDGPASGPDDLPNANESGIAFSADHTKLVGYISTGVDMLFTQINLDTADSLASWTNTNYEFQSGFLTSENAFALVLGNDDEHMAIIRRDGSTKDSDIRMHRNDGADAYMSRYKEVVEHNHGLGTTDQAAIFVSTDGTRLVEFHDTGSTGPIRGWEMTTPYDLSTATNLTGSSNVARIRARMHVNDAGTQIWGGASGTDMWTATLGTPWDFSTMTALSAENPSTPAFIAVRGIEFHDSGNKATVHDAGAARLYTFTLATPYDLSTDTSYVTDRVQTGSGSPPLPAAAQYFGGFNHDGTRTYFSHINEDLWGSEAIMSFTLSTPYDIKTRSPMEENVYVWNMGSSTCQAVCYARNGTVDQLYFCGTNSNNRTHQLTYQDSI